jgi:hypothetical protein
VGCFRSAEVVKAWTDGILVFLSDNGKWVYVMAKEYTCINT